MNKKRKIVSILILLLMTMLLASTANAASKKIKLNKKKATIYVNSTLQLKLKKAKASKVKWSSSKKAVATVSKKGKVVAKKAGKTTITAKYKGKKYKCKITVKAKPVPVTYYGTVSGNITYHYNQYKGYVADTNARVFLIPTNGSAKSTTVSNYIYFTYPNQTLNSNNIYYATVDGTGNYTINNVPTGQYLAVVVSYNCKTKDWFDAYDDTISDAPDSFYQDIASTWGLNLYLNSTTALNLAKSFTMHNYRFSYVTVSRNSTYTLSEAFPYTYI